MKIRNISELAQVLPEEEWILTDLLRQIVLENLPEYCKEKISYNVPYFYGNKGICIIWPASIPRGGFSQGVLFGFWQGYLLDDGHYLTRGTNTKIFYKIFKNPYEVNPDILADLLQKAVDLDVSFKTRK
ncbi:MAG: DUF1801 domain-containing protein [Saprospiraceae bacterium]